jgi:hypothetical protein
MFAMLMALMALLDQAAAAAVVAGQEHTALLLHWGAQVQRLLQVQQLQAAFLEVTNPARYQPVVQALLVAEHSAEEFPSEQGLADALQRRQGEGEAQLGRAQ